MGERAVMLVATVGGPAIPLVQLGAYYVAVPVACSHGDVTWPLHLITIVALAAVAAATAISWRGLRRAGEDRRSHAAGINGDRRFVYAVALILASLAAVAVVLMGMVNLYFDPCEGDHEFRLPTR